MAKISGSFTDPAATDSVSYAAGGAVTFSIEGAWPKAIINGEVSHDAGATWETVWCDFGIEGASCALYNGQGAEPRRSPGSQKVYPPGAGLFRLNCIEFRSGWCDWTLSS